MKFRFASRPASRFFIVIPTFSVIAWRGKPEREVNGTLFCQYDGGATICFMWGFWFASFSIINQQREVK